MMALGKTLLAFLALFALALVPGCRSDAPSLPALKADVSQTSVSGLSSGGYMAGQYHLAHSKTVTGAAILAAGPYGCAESPGAAAFPVYPAAVLYNLTQAQSACMSGKGNGALDSTRLLRLASELADAGKIDPLSGLKHSKVYLYTGADDRIVVKAVVEAAQKFYLAAGVPAENIEFVTKNPGGHAFLTAGFGEACGSSDPPYVSNCQYDQAGAILRAFYGELAPKTAAKPENFVTFGQKAYAGQDATLADEGVVYIPSSCRTEAGCRIHVVFHGCQQSRAVVGDAFIRGSGFADWAEANRIAVLFPQVTASHMNPAGCWDWWGYTGLDYLTQSAPQIKAVEKMVSRLAEAQ
jgi:poly(3-hydroxybutyrate) depolymerase